MRCVYLNNPALTRVEFVEMLARNFDLSAEARESKAALLAELERVLHERRSGEITALVVDEAQSLSTELLEEIRLLANIETTTEKLLPLVLVGSRSWRPPRGPRAAPAEAARRAALRDHAVHAVGNRGVHREPHPNGRRRASPGCSPGKRSC